MTPSNSAEAAQIAVKELEEKFGISIEKTEDGEAASTMQLLPHHRNFYGMPYGAVLFNLADVTCGMAYLSVGGNGVTVSGSVNYLRGADKAAEALHCHAHVSKRGKRLCFISAEITDDRGRLLSTYNFIFSDI